MRFTSHHKHIKRYSFMGNNCHRQIPRNWQRAYKTKLQENFAYNQVGWEKVIGLGPLPLGGVGKEEKVLTERPLPWGAKESSYRWRVQVLVSYMEATNHLTHGGNTQMNSRAGEGKSLLPKSVYVLTCIKRVRRSSTWQLFPHNTPSRSGENIPALFLPQHCMAQHPGQLGPGRRLGIAMQRKLGLAVWFWWGGCCHYQCLVGAISNPPQPVTTIHLPAE